MKRFTTREAARILEATEAQVRTWARLGPEAPGRSGTRIEFTFQELLLLRTIRGLVESGVPAHRVRRIWSSLRRQLAAGMPLTGITIFADGRRAVAWDGNARWQPDSGQFLLELDAGDLAKRAGVAPLPHPGNDGATAIGVASIATLDEDAIPDERSVRPDAAGRDRARFERRSSRRSGPVAETVLTAEQWFQLATELEVTSETEARHAYEQALELDPGFADAHVNLGRLYHEMGELGKAEAHYRSAVRLAPADAVGHFNLGVLLEDRGRPSEAVHAYQQALAREPDLADAHYNLALLLESLGRRSAAMGHLLAAERSYGRGSDRN